MTRGRAKGTPKTGGRVKGVPNKINAEAREVFKAIFDRLAPQAEGWIEQAAITDPAKAAELTLRMAQHFIPKLNELTGKDGGPVTLDFSVDLRRSGE